LRSIECIKYKGLGLHCPRCDLPSRGAWSGRWPFLRASPEVWRPRSNSQSLHRNLSGPAELAVWVVADGGFNGKVALAARNSDETECGLYWLIDGWPRSVTRSEHHGHSRRLIPRVKSCVAKCRPAELQLVRSRIETVSRVCTDLRQECECADADDRAARISLGSPAGVTVMLPNVSVWPPRLEPAQGPWRVVLYPYGSLDRLKSSACSDMPRTE
jgi:hypothetical protein